MTESEAHSYVRNGKRKSRSDENDPNPAPKKKPRLTHKDKDEILAQKDREIQALKRDLQERKRKEPSDTTNSDNVWYYVVK